MSTHVRLRIDQCQHERPGDIVGSELDQLFPRCLTDDGIIVRQLVNQMADVV